MKTLEQRNVETVSEFIEAFWNRSELDCVDRFLSADYKELAYQSKEGLKKFAATILEAFPDKSDERKRRLPHFFTKLTLYPTSQV